MNMQESSFEALVAELDVVVAALERGGLPLDEALRLFEQGVRLTRECQDRLEKAELRVKDIRVLLAEEKI